MKITGISRNCLLNVMIAAKRRLPPATTQTLYPCNICFRCRSWERPHDCAAEFLSSGTALAPSPWPARRFISWSYEERGAGEPPRAAHRCVFLRDPALVPPLRCAGLRRRLSRRSPEDLPRPRQSDQNDPHFFDGVDLVISTSGPAQVKPRLVGDGYAHGLGRATELALGGPGRWTHHCRRDDSLARGRRRTRRSRGYDERL